MQHAGAVLRPLRDHTYRRLYLAQVVALLGTGLATVALGLLAYDIAGAQAGQVLGTALAIKMVAYVVVAPVMGAAVERLPRRAVLVGADALRMAVALCLPFVGEVWQVYVLVFVLQASSATFTPTFQSTIPDVLPDEEDYTAALSLSRLAYDLESVLSPAVAAAVLLVVSTPQLFVGTAIGFAASGILVLSVALPTRPPAPADHAATERSPFGARVRRGTALFLDRPALRPVLALNLVVACAGAFVIVQSVVVVRSVLGLGEEAVAWVLAANGLGSMIAAFRLPRVLRAVPERTVMCGGALALTVVTALIPLALSIDDPRVGTGAVVVLWIAIGIGWSCVETPVGRIIRRAVDPGELPAAFAAQFSLQHACWLLTYPVAGWLGAAAGLTTASIVLATLAGAATTAAIVAWPRSSAREKNRPIRASDDTMTT